MAVVGAGGVAVAQQVVAAVGVELAGDDLGQIGRAPRPRLLVLVEELGEAFGQPRSKRAGVVDLGLVALDDGARVAPRATGR